MTYPEWLDLPTAGGVWCNGWSFDTAGVPSRVGFVTVMFIGGVPYRKHDGDDVWTRIRPDDTRWRPQPLNGVRS